METVAKLRRPGRLEEQIADEASMSDDNVMITATINPLEEIDTDDEEVRSKPKTIPQENQPPNEEGISLLSFDGGGTRGSISAYILCVIEQRMRALTNDPDLQIGRYFNWFAGTSIGSFLALCMSHNNASPNTLMTAIVNNRDQIVKGKRIYSSDALEFYAKRLANGEREIRSVSEPKVLITTVRADRDPPRLEFITNYREESLDERNWKVWEAIRASSAAPTFFHSFDDKYVDGSLLAVVPATHAMADIHKYGGNRKLDLVLSLGTGEASTGRPLSIDLKLPKLRNFASTLKSDLQYVSGLFSMISAGFTYTEGDTNVANAWCGMIGANYYHLSPPFSKHLPIDEVKDESFVLMFYETYIYCLENDQKINAIAETLLKLGPRRHY
jgi:calcium-independent phospholipase A2